MKNASLLLILILSGCRPDVPVTAAFPSPVPRPTPPLVTVATPAPTLPVIQSGNPSFPVLPQMVIVPTPLPRRIRRKETRLAAPQVFSPSPFTGGIHRGAERTPVPPQNLNADRQILREIASKIRGANSEDELILIDMNLERAQNDPVFAGFSTPQNFRLSALRSAAQARANGFRRTASSPLERADGDELSAEMYFSMALR